MTDLSGSLATSGLMPHGYCLAWSPPLLWTTVVSDGLIGLAYFSIPTALIYFVRQRDDLQFNWIILMFGAFILACGGTHVLDVVTIWTPVYWFDAGLKAVTAGVSLATAWLLWVLVPRLVAFPSRRDLQMSEERYRVLAETLERRVSERTAELQAANARLEAEIRKRERSEAQLREANADLNAIVENLPMCVFAKDPHDLRIVRFNRAGEKMIGMPREQLLGKVDGDIFPRELAIAFTASDFAALASTDHLDLPEQWVDTPAGRRLLHTRKVAVRDAEGRPRYLLGISEDVTERQKARDALVASQNRLNAMIRDTPAPIAMFDRGMRFIAASQGWRQTYGLGAQELGGRQYGEVLPDIPDRWRAAHARCLAGGVERCDEDRFERSDGRVQWLNWEVRPWLQDDGGVGGVVIYSEDVTQRRQADEELRRLYSDLERRVVERTAELDNARLEAVRLAGAKSEFLAHMSHEIRTPLNAVLGWARIGERDSAGRAAGQTFTRILTAGEHLLGVINNILDYARIERDGLILELRPFAMAAMLDHSFSFVAEAARQKGLDLDIRAAPDLPAWVIGDEQRLRQILLNLLSNAVKFTESGFVRLEVSGDQGELTFRVSDTGIGMSEDHVRRLFKPFEQADRSITRRYGGTGLGLAISQSLARLMGGQIAVTSQPGVGTAFTLRLRLEPAEQPQRAAGPAPAPERRLGGIRVLAAEDAEVNRLILEDMLLHEGAEVVLAANGLEAVQRLADAGAAGFDVVLMDIQMPGMDGYEATRRIVRLAPGLPVIGLTAHALAEERRRCLEAGMVERLTKPVTPDLLVTTILGIARRPASAATPRAEVAPAPPPHPSRVIDWPALVARYARSREVLDRLMDTALQTLSEVPAILRRAAGESDADTLGSVAHRLRGSAGAILADELLDVATRTENAVLSGERQAAIGLGQALAAAVEALLAALAERRGRPFDNPESA